MDAAGEEIIARASAGARLLTVRGAGMRVISVLSNLALIVLVAPAGLGLLAVVRGATGLAGSTSDLGFAWALLRRPDTPTDEEYGALAGLQLTLLAGCLAVIFLAPARITAALAIPGEWQWWFVAVLLTMITVPFGTSAKIRLERQLDYRRIARLDFSSVLLQNVLLLGFAMAGRFGVGVFITTAATILYTNLLLWFWSPGPLPAFRLGAWRRLGREFAGFTAGHVGSMLGAAATPILIAHLLGLGAAGIWAFAVRLGNVIQLAFEGFRRAVVPAAATLTGSPEALRRLVQGSLHGAARLTLPMMAALIAGLPVLGWLVPRWAEAVLPAQCFVVGFGLAGLLAASVVPVGVALRGARVILIEQFVPVLVGWSGFVLLALLGRDEIAWVILPMHAALMAALWWTSAAGLRPVWTPELRRGVIALAVVIGITVIAQLTGIHPLLAACVAGAGFLIAGGHGMLLAPSQWPMQGRQAW